MTKNFWIEVGRYLSFILFLIALGGLLYLARHVKLFEGTL